MQSETTITDLQTGSYTTKQHYTVIAYLQQIGDQTGAISIYKTLQKNFSVLGKKILFLLNHAERI